MQKSLLGRGLGNTLLAKDLARLTRETDRHAKAEAARMLARRMGALRGLPQKLGQSMSLSPDAEAAPFNQLTDKGEPLPFPTIEKVLQLQWGRPWQEVLRSLSPDGLAASLGQVHRGRLHDGTEVAVKVAYPGIREAITADLKMLGWLGKAGERFLAGFQYDSYQKVILTDLEEELDYRLEAKNQEGYRERAAGDEVLVPEVLAPWSNDSVLVTRWLDGLTIEAAADWPQPMRQALGTSLASHFLRMFFDHGWIHADPHRGNYRFRSGQRGPEVVLYDYGSVARFEPETRLLLMRLILCTGQGVGDPFPLLVGLGFNQDLLAPLSTKLPALCNVLFEPFLTMGAYDHHGWDRAERLEDVLGEDRWNFRMSGPASLVFLVRGFQGIFYYLNKLGVTVNWGRLFQQLVPRHLAEAMALRLPKCDGDAGFATLAKNLRIRLDENGVQKVALTFPAAAVERLEALMGDEITQRVRERGIEPRHVIQRARKRCFAAGELFELEMERRHLRVWLE